MVRFEPGLSASGLGIVLQGPVGFNHFYVVWEIIGIFKKFKEASETPNILEKEWELWESRGWGGLPCNYLSALPLPRWFLRLCLNFPINTARMLVVIWTPPGGSVKMNQVNPRTP